MVSSLPHLSRITRFSVMGKGSAFGGHLPLKKRRGAGLCIMHRPAPLLFYAISPWEYPGLENAALGARAASVLRPKIRRSPYALLMANALRPGLILVCHQYRKVRESPSRSGPHHTRRAVKVRPHSHLLSAGSLHQTGRRQGRDHLPSPPTAPDGPTAGPGISPHRQ